MFLIYCSASPSSTKFESNLALDTMDPIDKAIVTFLYYLGPTSLSILRSSLYPSPASEFDFYSEEVPLCSFPLDGRKLGSVLRAKLSRNSSQNTPINSLGDSTYSSPRKSWKFLQLVSSIFRFAIFVLT